MSELTPSRLRLEHLNKGYLLRAPSALGQSPLSSSAFISQMGQVLRAAGRAGCCSGTQSVVGVCRLGSSMVLAGAGVRCDLTEKGVSGKPTVTHNLKKYALNLAGLVGVDYAKISHLGSHDRDVTRNHYLTVCLDAMHRQGPRAPRYCKSLLGKVARTDGGNAGRMAGYGPNWQQAHILGRQVALPSGMRELIAPGLHPLLASLRATHPDHPLLPALEAAEWLTEVFVQDMAPKLQLHGRAWACLFPREVAAVTSHPGWPAFARQVLAKDAFAKGVAGANRDFLGNPVTVCVTLQTPLCVKVLSWH